MNNKEERQIVISNEFFKTKEFISLIIFHIYRMTDSYNFSISENKKSKRLFKIVKRTPQERIQELENGEECKTENEEISDDYSDIE